MKIGFKKHVISLEISCVSCSELDFMLKNVYWKYTVSLKTGCVRSKELLCFVRKHCLLKVGCVLLCLKNIHSIASSLFFFNLMFTIT